MSTIPTSVFSANSTEKLDTLVAFPKPTILLRNPSMASTATWTLIPKPISQNPTFRTHSSSSSSFPTCTFLGIAQEFFPSSRFSGCGLHRIGEVRPSLLNLNNDIGADGVLARGYGSAAEVVPVSSTEGDEDGSVAGEVEELLKAVKRAEKNAEAKRWRVKRVSEMGMQDWKYRRLKRRQILVETEAWEKAASEYRTLMADMCEQKLAPNLPYIKSLLLGWFEPMRDAVIKEQKLCQRVRHNGHAMHFDELPADMMSLITMHKLMALLMSGGGVVKLAATACSIGEAIEHEIRIQKFLEKTKKKKVGKNKKNAEAGPDSETNEEKLRTEATNLSKINEQEKLRKKVTTLLKRQKLRAVREIVKGHDGSQPWSQELKAKVGSRLLELLIETAYVQPPANQLVDGPPDIRPAFVHTVKSSLSKDGRTRHLGIIQCDPLILKGLDTTARHMVIPYMPMLIPPVKWTGYDKGAHLFLPSYVMRTHGDRQQRQVLAKAPKKQLEPVYKALDILGSTKWRVNKRVLDIVDTIWNNGGRLAGLVDRDNVPLPEGPDTEDEVELQKWKWKLRSGKKENRERYSQRCDIELKLAVARKLKDEEGFYYPHNLDFRGRAYPMHPYLNHLGSDLCRGILEFGEGRPLGESGLRWLKIHLANLYAGGADKLSLEGRIVFTESHLDDIFDSADFPLEGRRWWLNAEDPFQCLAACITLTEALRSSSPETFVSHVPVHQDGSCNGLQHYAALGRDKVGAAAVNLIAGDKPADVYSDIASRVLHIMQGDAEKDPADFPDALSARILINQVDRKLVKQTVMTSVYGVTYIGARDQIKRRLKERDVIADEQVAYTAACYAAKVTLTALGEMFEGARGIMNWLGECAKVIAHENQAVCWTTPLGLPAVQPYRKLGKNMVKTSLQVLTLHQETEKVMVKRQRTAFPPNFVHSLDGSHMMMTALACYEEGLTFAGVHDSYWTHACDVDEMNRILREKFVELYETPVLENVLESFQESFPELTFPPLPERGDFNLRDVLDSPYFFN